MIVIFRFNLFIVIVVFQLVVFHNSIIIANIFTQKNSQYMQINLIHLYREGKNSRRKIELNYRIDYGFYFIIVFMYM